MSAPNRSSDQAGKPPGRVSRLTAAGLLAVAGGLHLAALPSHQNASTVAGAFFAVTAAAQLLGAVLVVTRPSARTIHAVVAGNVAVLVLWATSRTAGLPIGGELGVREPFGLLDGLAATAELLVVVAGLAIMVRAPRFTGRRHGSWQSVFALVLAWMISGGAGLAVADGGHQHEGGHVHRATASGGRSYQEPELSQPAVPVPSHGGFDLGEPVREHSHDTPASSGHRHDAPAPDRAITGSGCPAGHDCTGHPFTAPRAHPRPAFLSPTTASTANASEEAPGTATGRHLNCAAKRHLRLVQARDPTL